MDEFGFSENTCGHSEGLEVSKISPTRSKLICSKCGKVVASWESDGEPARTLEESKKKILPQKRKLSQEEIDELR